MNTVTTSRSGKTIRARRKLRSIGILLGDCGKTLASRCIAEAATSAAGLAMVAVTGAAKKYGASRRNKSTADKSL
jgi:hypothetical protein